MIDQAKENLNVETGVSGSLNKIQKEFEIQKSKLNEKELEEAAKKNAELKQIEEENFNVAKPENAAKVIETQQTGRSTTRKTGIERANASKNNLIEKAIAGGNIPQDMQKPEKGPAKRIQNFARRILGSKNME